MKNRYKIIAIILSSIILLPILATAQGIIPPDTDIAENGFCAFAGMINTIINWLISMSAVIAAVTFSIAGARMLLHPEDPGERQKAIEMFKKTVIGLIIILFAWLAVHAIVAALVPNSSGSTGALRFLGNSACK